MGTEFGDAGLADAAVSGADEVSAVASENVEVVQESQSVEVEAPVVASNIDPATLPFYKRLDKTTLTGLAMLWLTVITYMAWLVTYFFVTDSANDTWDSVLWVGHWVFWGFAAVSSAAALMFGRWRERFAAILMLTIIAIDIAMYFMPIQADHRGFLFYLLRGIVDVNLLAAATYIATRKPRVKS